MTSSPGNSWTGSKAGTAPTVATFTTQNDPTDRITAPGQARFVIRVTATSAGLGAWTPNAYVGTQPCTPSVGPPASAPLTFMTGPAPTPTPTPAGKRRK